MIVLSVSELDVHYGSAQVLRRIGLEVPAGRCMALLGRNGAGKTTLLRCIAGVLPATGGRVLLDGADVTSWLPHRRARTGIGTVPQGREVFAELTVAENLDVARKALSIRDPSTVEEVAALFPALRSLWRRRAGSLSGGQQQLLAIARALIGRPGLLLLDEPTEGIQPSVVRAIEDVIHGLKGRMTILLVEQYLDFAREIADSFGVISRGTIIADGTIAQLDLGALQHHLAL